MKSEWKYKDQRGTEIYDHYDWMEEEPVPEIIANAKVIREDGKTRQVRINYPIYKNTFTLNGGIGYNSAFGEDGKKAFVRGGKYTHPDKGFTVEIVEMAPIEYVESCREMFNSRSKHEQTLEELIDSRTDYDVTSFDRVTGNIFPPVIDWKRKDQEGLHRAIYADKKGLNKIPVVVIR